MIRADNGYSICLGFYLWESYLNDLSFLTNKDKQTEEIFFYSS